MDNMFTPSAKHVLAIAQEQAKLLTKYLNNFLLQAMIFVKKLNA